MNESVFTMWDSDSNGMIDTIEIFCVMILFADGRIEDKIRFIAEFFDFNQNNYLEEVDLLFIAFNAINGTVKIFQVESELPTMPGSGGDQAYKIFEDNVVHNFEKNARIGINELMAWCTET